MQNDEDLQYILRGPFIWLSFFFKQWSKLLQEKGNHNNILIILLIPETMHVNKDETTILVVGCVSDVPDGCSWNCWSM